VPVVSPVRALGDWLASLAADDSLRLLLSLQPDAQPLPQRVAACGSEAAARRVLTLNGPEGGLTPDEETAARRAGFLPTTMGRRVLRADTAPLAVLAALGALNGLG
jgi:16S rRNA (uracil1498-N3)-methyltransferase